MDNEMSEYKDSGKMLADLKNAKKNIINGDDDLAMKIIEMCIKSLEGSQPEMEQDSKEMKDNEFSSKIKEAYSRA